jgi:hypothetical protein
MGDTGAVILEDPHLCRPSRERLWQELAERVRRDPSSLDLPLANIERWLAQGRLQAAPLLEWRKRLEGARRSEMELAALTGWMEEPNHDSEPLKSCSPFPGLLSEAEWEMLKDER